MRVHEQIWNGLTRETREFLLACLEGDRPRGRQYESTIRFLLKRRLFRYRRLTDLGVRVAEYGEAQSNKSCVGEG